MSKFTPGPWRLVKAEDNDGSGWLIAHTNHYVICSTNMRSDQVGTEQANGRLIKESPDMLDICLAILEAARYEPEPKLRSHFLDEIRAVVSRATGEQP